MIRLMDIILSLVAILFLFPIFACVIIVLRFTGEGEIFYLQSRIGKGGNPFNIIKFATMLKNSPNIGTGTVTVKGDPRVLPVGKFLRKTKINELPQIINILVGDMSFIGPRPVTVREFDSYSPSAKEAIIGMRPGLSGLGSVVFRDEESIMDIEDDPRDTYNYLIGPYKGELEEWYSSHQSVVMYFKLLFLTAFVVVRPKSACVWKLIPQLPKPPEKIRMALNYPPV